MSIFLAFMPLIMKLVMDAEQAFTQAKSGAVKKATVTATATDILTGLAAVSTGGQANTVAQVQGLLSPMIDLGVAVMNSGSVAITGKPVIVDDSSDHGAA